MTKQIIRKQYKSLTDKELIALIVDTHPDEEAAAYLINTRYKPLLVSAYCKVFNNDHSWYGDCINDLFIYLKGNDMKWDKFRAFEWRSAFATWFGRLAYNRFKEIKPKLIGKITNSIYIDNNDNKNCKRIPDTSVHEYENQEMRILLMEAIGLLDDKDQRFVVLKRLQGYNSKEIAILMQKRWEKHGIVKFNNKNQRVVPDAAYVDVRMQRAKDNLEKIFKKLM